MNWIKRTFWHTLRTKKETALVVFVFLLLSTLVLSAICIRSAAEFSCEEIRRELGSTVTLRYKTTAGSEKDGFITSGMAATLDSSPYVGSTNRIVSTGVTAGNFSPCTEGAILSEGQQGKPSGDVLAYGVTDTASLDEFKKDSVILEGRQIAKSDVGKPVVLIEKALADGNNLKVGDSINLKSKVAGEQDRQFTIVGIYQNKSKNMSFITDTMLLSGNKLYMPYDQVLALTGTDVLEKVVFSIDDPINIPAFQKAAAKAVKIPPNCMLDANDAAYSRMTGPLGNLIFICNMILISVIVAGAVILALIILLSIKERRYEIGVLLAIGERKIKVILQLVLEMLIPIIIALSLSVAVGNLVAQTLGDKMLQSQVEQVENRSTDKIVTEKAVDKIQISLTVRDSLVLYSSGILIVTLSASVPVLSIIFYKPKDILTTEE